MPDNHEKHDAGHAEAAHGKEGHGGHKKHHHHGHGAHEEHEEGWIVSFADNVLLMMGFFVILLAMNMGPKATGPESEGDPGVSSSSAQEPSDSMLDFAIAVREAFHNPVQLDSTRPEDQPLVRRLKERAGKGSTTRPGPEGDDKNAQSVRPSDWSGKAGYVEFADQSSELTQPARQAIAAIAQEAAGTRWMVEVRGHSSKLEGWGDVIKSRKLAYDRAWSAANELVAHGVRWEQIRLVSSGDHAPVTPRARTTGEHATNQRAEILIMPETLPSDPYAEAGSSSQD
ncbi:MAG: flagellar motor protein MotB [Phycisphaerales bacterium]